MTHAHGLPDEVPATLNVLSGDADLPPLVQWPPFPEEDIISGNPNGHRGALLYRDPTGRYSVGVWDAKTSSTFSAAWPMKLYRATGRSSASLRKPALANRE